MYPGTYAEFLWRKEHVGDRPGAPGARTTGSPGGAGRPRTSTTASTPARASSAPTAQQAAPSREEKKRTDADARRKARAAEARRARIDELVARISHTEQAIRLIEQEMAAPGFYDERATAQPLIDRHQALMWEVGDLMHQWEQLQAATGLAATDA